MESFRQVFSVAEKEILLEFISEKSHIINNKQTNAISNELKMKTWRDITEKYNSLPGVTERSSKQLIECYRNIKRKARKAKAQNALNLLKSGEGPSVSSYQDEVGEDTAEEIVPIKLENAYDDDYDMLENSSPLSLLHKNSYIDFSSDVSNGSNIAQAVDNNQERDYFQSPFSSLANRSAFPRRENKLKKRKSISNEVENELWAQYRSKRKAIEDEHKLAVKHMEEKHKLEIEILKTKLLMYEIIVKKAKKDMK